MPLSSSRLVQEQTTRVGWLPVLFCDAASAAHIFAGIKGTFSFETASGSFGKGMLPKSQERQTLIATLPRKTELFPLNSRQRYDSTLAIELGKAHP